MTDYIKDDILIPFNFHNEIEYTFKLTINPIENTEQIIQNRPFLFLGNSNNYKRLHEIKKVETNYIGFTILEFLNNYEFIFNLCKQYESKIQNSNEELIINKGSDGLIDYEIECRDMLDDFMEKLNRNIDISHCATFLINDIYCFRHNFCIEIKNYTAELQNVIYEAKQELNKDNSNVKLATRLAKLETQLKEITETATFYKGKYLDFISSYKENLSYLYQLFANTFLPEYQEYQGYREYKNKEVYKYKIKRQNKYQNESVQLPSANIKLNNEDPKKITEYNYTISSLKDLGTISLYHIMLIRKKVKQCSYCKNYFIPKHDKESYCDRLQQAIKIQQNIIPTDNEEIQRIEHIKEVMTKDSDIIIKTIIEKDKTTQKKKIIKRESIESNKNLIQKDTMRTLFNTKTIKNENYTIKLIKNSCKELGKRKTYVDSRPECSRLLIKLNDRINGRIRNYKRSKNEKMLNIFKKEKENLDNLYNKVLKEYEPNTDIFYKKLHIELTMFDYEYIKKYPSTYKPFTSIDDWEENTKRKIEKLEKENNK